MPGSGNVGTVIAKGQFARSYICAGVLPQMPFVDSVLLDVGIPYAASSGTIGRVSFNRIDLDADTDFGLYAASEIKPFRIGRIWAEPSEHFRIDVPT